MASDVFVVGGGVAGLTLARDLAIGGRRVVVIERESRAGGQVTALDVESHQLDAAAESFATRTNAVRDLIDELGMADRIIAPLDSPAWVYGVDGTAAALPATGLLGVPSQPLRTDVRRSLGWSGATRAWVDRLLPRSVGSQASSFGDLVTARMGRAVTDKLVAPITRGVHSAEPSDVAIAQANPALSDLVLKHRSLARAIAAVRRQSPAGSAVASLYGGMHTLPIALAESATASGVEIVRDTEARDIRADEVTFAGSSHRGEVIMAAPPAGSGGRQATLVTVVATARAWRDAPRGTGVLVAKSAPGVHARALTHVSAKWAWVGRAFEQREVVRLSYDPDTVDPKSRAVNDAAVLMGADPEAVHTVIERRFIRASPLPAAERDTMRWTGESVAGTGLASVVAHARRTAAEVLAAR